MRGEDRFKEGPSTRRGAPPAPQDPVIGPRRRGVGSRGQGGAATKKADPWAGDTTQLGCP